MSLSADRFYALLPVIYRTRDAQSGGPLEALLAIIQAQGAILEENILQLYDDEFIETCASWAVPYIGELVGSTPLYEITGATARRRAEVANTIGYRRRKGTVLALEQVAMDVSGRPARAAEFFKRLITNESMRHIRPLHASQVNLRDGDKLSNFGLPFDMLNRTVDVRRIAPRVRNVSDPDIAPLDINLHGPGKDNIPDVAVYLWRWKSFSVADAPAFPVDGRRFMFSPLGQDMPLFNSPAVRTPFTALTTRLDVPQPIRRREFYEQLRQFYGKANGLELVADGVAIPWDQICCRDLSDAAAGWGCTPSGKVGIDPELGRIEFAPDLPAPGNLRVSYCYGFPAELGGGPYSRSASLPPLDPAQFQFTATVGSGQTLSDAVAAWNAQAAGTTGIIILPNYENYDIDLTGAAAIRIPSQSQLWIIAAQIHQSLTPLDASYSESCVTLHGDIEIRGEQILAGANVPPPGQLNLSGLWISGAIRTTGDAVSVQLMDCTLVPGLAFKRDGSPVAPAEPSIIANAATTLGLTRSISGPIAATASGTVRICSSIVDAASRCSIAFAGADLASEGAQLHIEDSTIIGKVWTNLMELASNTIFLARRPRHDPWRAAIWCSRRQSGCLRFCFVPTDSITPKRYRCLPEDVSLEGALDPKFVSLVYGNPSYGLLSGNVPMAIWKGADNGSQMGAYHFLQETEAIRNVQLRLPDFLPFGLEAGIFLEPSRTYPAGGLPSPYGYGVHRFVPCDDEEAELWQVGIGAMLL
jgi:hypothetical protein